MVPYTICYPKSVEALPCMDFDLALEVNAKNSESKLIEVVSEAIVAKSNAAILPTKIISVLLAV